VGDTTQAPKVAGDRSKGSVRKLHNNAKNGPPELLTTIKVPIEATVKAQDGRAQRVSRFHPGVAELLLSESVRSTQHGREMSLLFAIFVTMQLRCDL
jgi:hypothetical protein